MINIAICGDGRTEITYLSELVRRWAKARNIAVRLSDYESAESFTFAYEDDKAIDILPLDMQMKIMDTLTGINLTIKAGEKGNVST